ncbi:MAG: hypothetical protein ACOX6T_03495 [Myxococcales bacterium]|jgi:hypothetical protein
MAEADQAGNRRKPKGIGWLWWLVLAVAVVAGVGWLVWWGAVGEKRARGAVTVAAVLQNRELEGQTVVVTGRAAGPVGQRAFLLAGEAGERLLVLLGPEMGAAALPQAGREFQVTGEVVRIDTAALRREDERFAPETLAQWEGRPAVIASEVEPYVEEP